MNTIAGCTSDAITPGVVVFDPAAFILLYPAFTSVPAPALSANFNLATLQLNNSCCSVVNDAPTRSALLNLLTAHITALLNGVNGVAPSGLVGRISSATQGSVSVAAQFNAEDFSESYFAQTQWGVAFWQSTIVYRTAMYVPPCDLYEYEPSWPQ